MSSSTPPPDRLSMLDEYGSRQFIVPAEVKGFYHSAKQKVHFVLLAIFLLLPWIKINGHQAVFLDIPGRQFFILGLHLQAHNAPLIFFILFGSFLALALMTALFGRVWCGWACPQTVFIDSVYRKIELWTEGNYIARRKLMSQPMSLEKFWKSGMKWTLSLGVSFLIAHSFLAYWTGSEALIKMMQTSPSENFSYFVLVMMMTVIVFFNFAWFREQFCLIVCPYGKFQSTLLDSQTLNIMYDEKRGEPRKGSLPLEAPRGDCVSCGRCVQVCPTGIDIRNGLQMECIGCTACIDACDEIMVKLNRPKGLIRYKSLSSRPIQWFRARISIYLFLLAGVTLGLIFSLIGSSALRIEVLRGKASPFIVREDEGAKWVQNHFVLRLQNNSTRDETLVIDLQPNGRLIIPENPIQLGVGAKKDLPIFIEYPISAFHNGSARAQLRVQSLDAEKIWFQRNVELLGPSN